MSSPSRGAESDGARGSLYSDHSPDLPPTTPDVKRRGSRIPFLGRVKKKLSNNAVVSQPEPGPSEPRTPTIYLEPTSHLDLTRDNSHDTESPPRPSQSSARTTRTLGSKIVSSLTPKKSRAKSTSGYASDTLQSATIRPSFESAIRRDSRSTTPRPIQPTITVSPSPPPNQLHEFHDLFTRPRRKSAPKPTSSGHDHTRKPSLTTRVSASTSLSDSESSQRRSQLTPHNGTPPSSYDLSLSSQSDTDTGSRTSDRVSTQSSRSSHLYEPSGKALAISDESDATASGISVQRQRSKTLATKRTDSVLGRPPSIPLPTPDTPDTQQPIPPPFHRTKSEPARTRTQTLASTPVSQPKLPLKATRSISSMKLTADEIVTSFDVDSASLEDIRPEFKKRNRQYQELASILMSVREEHIMERSEMEQKIASLERDLTRKDKEIKGLTWLMKNRNMPPSPPAHLTSFSDSETRRLAVRGGNGIPLKTASTTRHPQHRPLILVDQEDSAPDSPSEASGWDSASSRRSRKVSTRPSIRSKIPQRDSAILSSPLPPIPSSSVSRRNSAASLGSSTSASSLPSTPLSTLTSIPETPPPVIPSLKTRDPAIAAALQAAEKHRDSQDSGRRSSSSIPQRLHRKLPPAPLTLPPTPAEAYIANLRHGGPTSSIAQVMDKANP